MQVAADRQTDREREGERERERESERGRERGRERETILKVFVERKSSIEIIGHYTYVALEAPRPHTHIHLPAKVKTY